MLMTASTISPMQAQFEMALLNAEAESTPGSNLYLWLRESGLPSEVAIRIQSLVDTTAEVAGKFYSIGKIVVIKIIEFVKAHPNMAIGMAVGASVGALTSMIPLLGPYLAPLSIAIGATIGAVAGHRSDKMDKGQTFNTDVIGIAQDLLEIAKEFFKLLIDIFNAVFTQAR